MVFTSLIYIVFLLLVLVLYFSIQPRHQALFLLIASFCFYAYWKPHYLLLLLAITTIDFFAAIGIEQATSTSLKRFCLGISIVANLGILFFYKYYDFLASQINMTFAWGGARIKAAYF